MSADRRGRIEEIEVKEKRIRTWMEEGGFAGLLLRQQKNFYWATAGGGNPVMYVIDPGFQSVFFTKDKRYVFSQQIEMPRLKEEETADLGFEYIQYNWWEEDQGKLACSLVKGKVGCDLELPGTVNVDAAVAAMRPTLTAWELDRFRSLGRDAARCVEQVCRELRPGMTELEIGASLLQKLYELNIRAIVLLVGADERVVKFRHPVASERRVEKYVMIGLCAERFGLIAPTSRFVHFGDPPDDLKNRYEALRKVAAVLNLSSKPGTTIGSALQEVMDAYQRYGYPNEWQRHYQGGVCGYAVREAAAGPGGQFTFQLNQVLGWNPTITGTKIEDSFIIRKDGLENITLTPSWPCREETVDGGSLVLPDILIR
jgi:Xaa-Pro dipeptidase